MTRRVSWKDAAALAALVLGTALGCWDQLVERAQPVGGDKSLFFIGLMSYYGNCLHEGSLAFWNAHWGFGFPTLAESQTGVFYPPHLVLYRWLDPLDAFRWNLLLHRFSLVVLCYVSVRGVGLAPLGAWLATLAFTGGGFVVGHRDHQWAVLSAVWLPPAVWASDAVVRRRSRWATLVLPMVLAGQLLIGHFQVAFITVVASGLYVLALSAQRRRADGLARWVLCVLLGYALAMIQLLPTYRFVEYVREVQPKFGGREFLSTHALPPVMLVNLIAPSLYFREPLWREVVWTPLHTAPEECLNYVGLVPLALAFGGAWRFRRTTFVRCWVVVLLAAFVFSFGPFFPGYDLLIRLPGFSYFRSAARWTLALEWSLALLAGWTADRVRTPQRLLRWWRGLLLAGAVAAGLVGGWWWCFDRAARDEAPLPAGIATVVTTLLPWENPDAAERMRQNVGNLRTWDEYTLSAWLRLDRPNAPARLLDCWATVWRVELLPTLAVVGLGTALVWIGRRWPRRNRWVIIVICVVDLGWFQLMAPETTVPRETLTTSGPLLGRLAELPRGSRVIAPGGNLPIAWGLANVPSYRTLDVPLPEPADRVIDRLASNARLNLGMLQAPPLSLLGIKAIVWYPTLLPTDRPLPEPPANTVLAEPAELERWVYGHSDMREMMRRGGVRVMGMAWVAPWESHGGLVIQLSRLRSNEVAPNGRVDLVGLYAGGPVAEVGAARPIADNVDAMEWSVTAREPAVLVLPVMFAPGWDALLQDGERATPVPVRRVDRFWCGVELPAAGSYTVRLVYRPPGLAYGAALTIVAACVWLIVAITLRVMQPKPKSDRSPETGDWSQGRRVPIASHCITQGGGWKQIATKRLQ